MKTFRVAAGMLLAVASTHAFAQAKDWPSYNRNLNSDRYATLSDIDTKNVATLKVVCSYDTGEQGSFQSGLLMVDGSLYGTTEHDTFSLDPNSCKLNWRTHEDSAGTSRGVAWLDKRVFRGAGDGTVVAYDARTGKKLWATAIADPKKGESVPAAPIAWNGLVFVGNAGGDSKGVRGRMYALDATSGKVVWEFFLVPKGAGDAARGPEAPNAHPPAASWKNAPDTPITGGTSWTSYSLDPRTGSLFIPTGPAAPTFNKEVRPGENLYTNSIVVLDAKTGAYQKHVQLVKRDYHNWDVSSAPVLFPNRKGQRVMAATPKDGNLYLIDVSDGHVIYRKPITQILNADAPITAKGTRFCPGTQGGSEWNGAAFDPANNLLLTGAVHWCTTVKAAPAASLAAIPAGGSYTGASNGFGTNDDPKGWAGFLTATDADTGVRKWQFKVAAPITGGVTPTSGRLVLFGDMAGTFYALDALNGQKLLATDLGGAIGGGVIVYDTNQGEKVAVAVGMVSSGWPVPKVNGKVVVLGVK